MKRVLLAVLLVLLAGAAAWWGWRRFRPPPPSPPPVDLTQHDGQTIDFSSGRPVVKDTAAERAALEKTAAEMADAAQGVTFDAPKKKAEAPPAPPARK